MHVLKTSYKNTWKLNVFMFVSLNLLLIFNYFFFLKQQLHDIDKSVGSMC